MGYIYNLKTNKTIKKQDVQDIVDTLPDNLQGAFKGKESNWGWSCGCDIYYPIENILEIGGSYGISGDIAEEFVQHIISELEKKDYKVINNVLL